MLKIGLDIGYGYTKAVASNGRSFNIPSIVGEGFQLIHNNTMLAQQGFNSDKLDNLCVEIDNQKFFVGELASIESLSQSYVYDQDKIDHINFKVLIATSVALLLDEPEDISIVVGLPYSDYVKQKKKLQAYLNNFDNIIKLNGVEKHIRFHTAAPFPQSAGAIFELKKYYSFDPSGYVACVDIGTKTTDFTVFIPQKTKLVESMSSTINVGAHFVHSYVNREMEYQSGIRLDPFRVESIIRNGAVTEFDGRKYDLNESLRNGKSDLVKRISDEIAKNWAHGSTKISKTFLVGGGAQLLKEQLSSKYSSAVIPEQPEMMNARGFLIVANKIAQDYI